MQVIKRDGELFRTSIPPNAFCLFSAQASMPFIWSIRITRLETVTLCQATEAFIKHGTIFATSTNPEIDFCYHLSLASRVSEEVGDRSRRRFADTGEELSPSTYRWYMSYITQFSSNAVYVYRFEAELCGSPINSPGVSRIRFLKRYVSSHVVGSNYF